MDFPVSNSNLFRDKKKNLCLSSESVYDDYRIGQKKNDEELPYERNRQISSKLLAKHMDRYMFFFKQNTVQRKLI